MARTSCVLACLLALAALAAAQDMPPLSVHKLVSVISGREKFRAGSSTRPPPCLPACPCPSCVIVRQSRHGRGRGAGEPARRRRGLADAVVAA